nr:serine/threonine protein kinase [PVC group bacterium]
MSSAEDSAFADMALEMGLVSRKEIEICREALRAADGNGGKFRLSGILRERKYLAKKQVLEVYRALHQQGLYPRIGNYEIMAKLGQGAMGRVYQARQADTSRVVALKVLPRRLSRDTRFLQRFQREAQAMSKLDHPNIVQALDVGEADGYQFFAMEYIEGRTVKELMNRHGPIEEEQALPIAIQVAKALKHANDFGIVHRDVKPSNIMITRDGTAKLCDLGLAKETSEEDDSQLTMSGTAVGTAYYIAPEQARGVADVDIRSDIYSLGATLYHMVVGEVPFEGSSPAVVMTKHVTEALPPAKERNLALSDHVCNIVEKMMAKDRERRYQTPEELTEDLELALEGRPPGASLTAYMATDSTAEAQAVVDVPGPSERPADPAAVKLGGRYVLVATVIVVAMALAAWSVAFSLKHTRQVADQMRQDHAKRLYLLAEQFASENPDDVLSAISRFDMVAQAARNTDYAHEAMQRGATLRKRLDATAAPLFLRLKTEGDELAKAQQFAKALSVWDRFPGAYAVGDWLDKIAVEKEAYRDLAKRQYANLEADAKALLESGSFTAATETYKTAELFSTPEIAAQAAAQIRQIEAKQRESHAQRVFQDAVQAYEKGQHHAAKRLVEQLAALYPQFDLTSAESGPEGQALSLAQLRGLLAD